MYCYDFSVPCMSTKLNLEINLVQAGQMSAKRIKITNGVGYKAYPEALWGSETPFTPLEWAKARPI